MQLMKPDVNSRQRKNPKGAVPATGSAALNERRAEAAVAPGLFIAEPSASWRAVGVRGKKNLPAIALTGFTLSGAA